MNDNLALGVVDQWRESAWVWFAPAVMQLNQGTDRLALAGKTTARLTAQVCPYHTIRMPSIERWSFDSARNQRPFNDNYDKDTHTLSLL